MRRELAFSGQTPAFGFGYDALSRRTDNIYQLLSAKQGTTTKETYTYDLVGNRLSSLGVSPYSYNSSNELTALPSGSYTYDSNGNTKTKPDGSQHTWDYENRLTQVVLPGAGGTVNFKYDPFGRRIQKAFTQNGTTTTKNYVYDGPNILETLDANGNLLSRYIQGKGIDEPLAQLISGATSYYEQDGLGSITSMSNALGALVDTYNYDSFGKLLASSGTVPNPFQYTGREFDTEIGIYYYRARYFDPSLGRFANEDPIRSEGGINFYRYVGNSVINRTDPDGMGTAACLKALEKWALAYAAVQERLGLFNGYGDGEPGHAESLKQALNRLKNATDEVKNNCNCDASKAEVTAVIAAAAALADRVAESLSQFCAEDPEICLVF